jgi:amino acid transporter
MNKFQLSALFGGLANVLFMVLFPPYDRVSLGRIEPSFDAYHFVLQAPAGQTVNAGLLVVQLLAVAFVVILALMFLRGSRDDPEHPPRNPQTVVLTLAVAAFVMIMLFPPFETMPASRLGAATFHGFDLAFGGGVQRGIFVPMLFLELLMLGVNVSAFWLIFGVLDRRDLRVADMQKVLSEQPVVPARPRPGSPENPYGRSGDERRRERDPGYQGPERRRSRDRRTV